MMPMRDHCSVCGGLLTLHERFSGRICGNWRCRSAKLYKDLRVYRREAATALGIENPETFEPVVVPFRTRPIVKLSEERRSDFFKFLAEILAEAFGDQESDPDPPCCDKSDGSTPEGIALAAEAAAMVCGACVGVCCHHGGCNHAFLDSEALRCLRSTRPGLTPEEAASAYAAHLPNEHFEGACVYQTRTGCALPRDLRAPLCNAYQCRGLREAIEKLANNPSQTFIVIARQDNRIIRSAFVDALGIRRYPPG
jgi:hypothetical protein